MRRIWVIAKRDYLAVVRTRGFLLSLIFTPILMAGLIFLPIGVQKLVNRKQELHLEIVDQTGMITPHLFQTLQQIVKRNQKVSYKLHINNKAPKSAQVFFKTYQPLLKKKRRFALVWFDKNTLTPPAPDPKKKRPPLVQIRVKSKDFIKASMLKRTISSVITRIRLLRLGAVAKEVMQIRRDSQSLVEISGTEGERLKVEAFLKRFMTGIIFIVLLFMTIQLTGHNLVTSVIEEKSSRIMEVLLSSITPTQLMVGKVLGLGAAGLTMVSVFACVGYIGSMNANIPIQLENLLMFVVYYILAFALYSFLLAGIGSICTTEKEAQQLMAPVMMTLILPAIVNMAITENPDGTLAIVLSMFPFTAPGAMLSRMGATSVPLLQVLLSIGLMLLASLMMMWISVQVFRIGVLMYGKRPSIKEIIRWVRAG